jgi:TolB-like protein/DNA-binding winged helix-turn-helix (wHTH) protein
MNQSHARPHLLRFSVFEVDLRTRELRKQGLKVKLHGQPIQVLAMLLERPGELVTREEIREKLWPGDTFIDFEHSVNSSIKRLREALGDDPAAPRFIETLPRHGYRFIAPVEGGATQELPLPTTGPVAMRESRLRRHWVVAVACGLVVAVVAVLFGFNVAGLRDRVLRAERTAREPPLPIQSIAVLPFENLSGDPGQEYFADGMTEELITNLGKISALRVISRTSVMQYKRTRKSLPQIARELNVDSILEGTVLPSGGRVRITANLLHAPTDRHLWAEVYERDLRDILALQSEVARAIADEIKAKMTPDVQARLARAHAVNPEAYEAYLKGTTILDNWTEESCQSAIKYFERAIQRDPGFAPAFAGLADAYVFLARFHYRPANETFLEAKQAARKALALDAN